MEFGRLSVGAKIAVIGGAVLVVNLFLPWYSGSDIGGGSYNAFGANYLAWGGSLVAIAGAGVLLLKVQQVQDIAVGRFAAEQLAVILAGLGTVLVVLRLLTVTSGASLGLYLGIVAAAAVTYGCWTVMKEAGLDLGMDDFTGGGGE
ncbi:MAG TPA: hypothetical protein VLD62_11795 [Acidimicrobiia bacterium]|nr:hypothetical protein [Acidimicrobiia bacterium]